MLKKSILFLFVLAQITHIDARGGRFKTTYYTDKDGCTHKVSGGWENQNGWESDTITTCKKYPKEVGKTTTHSWSNKSRKKEGTIKKPILHKEKAQK